MNRQRRRRDADPGVVLAAELLESRALLSAGAAAVHAATQHAAAVHPAKQHVAPTPIESFKGTMISTETRSGDPPVVRGADFSVGGFSPVLGANVSASFKTFTKLGNGVVSTTGTFKGKITAVIPLPGAKFEFDVQEVGNVTLNLSGFKIKALPDGTPMKLIYTVGIFQDLKVAVVFSPSAPGNLANRADVFEITPVPV